MSQDSTPFEECTIDGARSRRWWVDARTCRELAAHRIARLGIDEALPPYRRVRTRPEGSFIMVCTGGSGQVLLEGRWQSVRAGSVCMAPPRVLNAFHAANEKPWTFAWLRFDEPLHVSPLIGASSPVLVRGGRELARAIEGLRWELEGGADPAVVHHWVELLHAFARRLAQPFHHHERLRRLWNLVEQDTGAAWTLQTLARTAHMSAEHLRRVCRRELGRTPMHQVASIRMITARRLLESTDDKLDVIAEQVGYANAFVFSRAFKRLTGMSPAEYRGARPGSLSPGS